MLKEVVLKVAYFCRWSLWASLSHRPGFLPHADWTGEEKGTNYMYQ